MLLDKNGVQPILQNEISAKNDNEKYNFNNEIYLKIKNSPYKKEEKLSSHKIDLYVFKNDIKINDTFYYDFYSKILPLYKNALDTNKEYEQLIESKDYWLNRKNREIEQYKNEVLFFLDGRNNEIMNNIVIYDDMENILFEEDKVEILFSNKREYSQEQLKINQDNVSYKVNDSMIYTFEHGEKISPSKIIFSFPGMGLSSLQTKYMISKYSSAYNLTKENAIFICFQDNYGMSGTHLHFDDNGQLLKDSIIKFIDRKIKFYNLFEKDIVFIGASKGGILAGFYGQFFSKFQIISVASQGNVLASIIQSEFFTSYYTYIFKKNNLLPFIKKNISSLENIKDEKQKN